VILWLRGCVFSKKRSHKKTKKRLLLFFNDFNGYSFTFLLVQKSNKKRPRHQFAA
jgi:hypothetical protein